MYISINKPFADRLRQQSLTWIADPARELTETGKINARLLQKLRSGCRLHGKPSRRALSSSFKKCCISNALDGYEDDILWEDDGEDKDSDRVTDNGSVMGDDSKSDE
jgi:hypothetical protein